MSTAHPRLTTADRRARLARRHHLGPGAAAPDTGRAAASLIGLHSTDPASVYLSAWARVEGATHGDVDDALYEERSIVKHLAMRRTLWAVAADLLPVVQAAASDAVAAVQRRNLARDIERAGVAADGERWVRHVEQAVIEVLDESGPRFGRELSKLVPALRTKVRTGPGGRLEYGAISKVMTVLSASGVVTRARAGGAWHDRQPQWVLMRDWCPSAAEHPPLPVEPARAALARSWLGAFGPATAADLKWWTGWTVMQTKAALRGIGAVEVEIGDGGSGVVLATDIEPEPPVGPWVALLPSLDPTTMGWKDRGWYLGSHRDRLFDPYGNAGPTVWSDGRIVGGWGQRSDGEVVFALLDDIGAEQGAAVGAAAGRLTAWLAGAKLKPSFPTPLQRELGG